MEKEQRLTVFRLAAAACLYIPLLIAEILGAFDAIPFRYAALIAFLIPYIICAFDIWKEAFEELKEKHFFDENLLMIIASVGAFAVGEYAEAVAVMLLFQIGEFLQDMAVDRSRDSVEALLDIKPEYAVIKRGGEVIKTDPAEVCIGDTVIIKPGERVPLDCRVIGGTSMIDTSAVTGESVPRRAEAGTDLLSGSINGSGLITAEVTAEYKDSTVSRILELVENANDKKAPTEKFITKFAEYYTPAVVFAALAIAFVPALFGASLSQWVHRACTFLVISCPCALVISVPLAFFGGIGAASSSGILIKGGDCLEKLAKLGTVIFDKTGTLTKGDFKVTEVMPFNCDAETLLTLAAAAESCSSHPIARSVMRYYGKPVMQNIITDFKETPGRGISATVGSHTVMAGSRAFMTESGIALADPTDETACGTPVYVAADGKYKGKLIIGDEIKDSAPEAVKALKRAGIDSIVMLTGDKKEPAEQTAAALEIDKVYYELLPDEKVEKMQQIKAESKNRTAAFIGDGINDAPVLKLADIGIAMGALGSDAAIEAADIVLVEDDLEKITVAHKIAKITLTTVKTNIIAALAVKFAVLVLGACGIASMWAAVFADVGVTLLAVINAMRILKTKRSL